MYKVNEFGKEIVRLGFIAYQIGPDVKPNISEVEMQNVVETFDRLINEPKNSPLLLDIRIIVLILQSVFP